MLGVCYLRWCLYFAILRSVLLCSNQSVTSSNQFLPPAKARTERKVHFVHVPVLHHHTKHNWDECCESWTRIWEWPKGRNFWNEVVFWNKVWFDTFFPLGLSQTFRLKQNVTNIFNINIIQYLIFLVLQPSNHSLKSSPQFKTQSCLISMVAQTGHQHAKASAQ